jgi:tetratricopeptide (TPR) repeat protein
MPPSQLFAQAISDFECGDYLAAIAKLEQAKQMAELNSSDDGEVQIWLANAYDAIGRTAEAIAICEKLKNHPERQIRKSAAFIQEIISAPKLSPIEDGKLSIPSLSNNPSDRWQYQTKPKDKPKLIPLPVSTTTKYQKIDQFAFLLGIAIALIWLGILI